jgi:hypothetical protein
LRRRWKLFVQNQDVRHLQNKALVIYVIENTLPPNSNNNNLIPNMIYMRVYDQQWFKYQPKTKKSQINMVWMNPKWKKYLMVKIQKNKLLNHRKRNLLVKRYYCKLLHFTWILSNHSDGYRVECCTCYIHLQQYYADNKKECPKDWKKFSGNCYKLLTDKRNWDSAKVNTDSVNILQWLVHSDLFQNW